MKKFFSIITAIALMLSCAVIPAKAETRGGPGGGGLPPEETPLPSDPAPTVDDIKNLELIQNGNELTLSFEAEKNTWFESGISIVAHKENATEEENFNGIDYLYLSFYGNEYAGGKYTCRATLGHSNYQSSAYGNYYVIGMGLYDESTEESISIDISLDTLVELKPENNILENLTNDQLIVETDREDNSLHFRENDFEIGDDYIYVNFTYQDSEYNLSMFEGIKNQFDLTKIGLSNQPFTFSTKINATTEKTFTVNIPVNVAKVEGEIVDFIHVKEKSIKFEDFNQILEKGWDLDFILKIRLNDGEIIYEPVTVKNGMGTGLGMTKGVFYAWWNYDYDLKYTNSIPDYEDNGSFTIYSDWFIVDDNGNLVDGFTGEVLLEKQYRKNQTYTSKNEEIELSSLFGSLPTKTEIKATENKELSDVFKDAEYVAYDMSLSAYNEENIQPADDVTVGVELPENLKGKEVEVYYVKDDGTKELVSNSKVVDGKVEFVTDHFSTYAVVAKEDSKESVVVDKDALDKAITEASELKENDYTPETWKVFAQALKEAKEVQVNKEATQEEVDVAVDALTKARKGLVEAKKDDSIPWTDLEPSTPIESEKGEELVDEQPFDSTTPVKEITVGVVVDENTKDIFKESISEELQKEIQAQLDSGKDVNFDVEMNKIDVKDVEKTTANQVLKLIGNDKVAQYLDLSILVKVDGKEIGSITELTKPITFQVAVPKDLQAEGRSFYVVRVHDGKAEKVKDCKYENGVVTFSTDKFSTYALAYTEKKPDAESPDTSDNNLVALYSLVAMLSAGIAVVLKKKRFN